MAMNSCVILTEIPLKPRIKKWCPIITTINQYYIWYSIYKISHKVDRHITNEKKNIKLLLSAVNKNFYLENPNKSTEKPLKIISEDIRKLK